MVAVEGGSDASTASTKSGPGAIFRYFFNSDSHNLLCRQAPPQDVDRVMFFHVS
jgi:hypothetical protein